MNTARIFFVLLFSDVVLEVASLARADGAATRGPLLHGLWLAVIASTVLGWVGLFAMVRAGRAIYLASWIGYLALLALDGPAAGSTSADALQMLMALVGGAVVAVAYLSDLRTGFRPLLATAS